MAKRKKGSLTSNGWSKPHFENFFYQTPNIETLYKKNGGVFWKKKSYSFLKLNLVLKFIIRLIYTWTSEDLISSL
jgi:hypothetical protein